MLDTNILILRPRIDPAELPEFAAISAVVLGELTAGVHHVSGGAAGADRIRAERVALLQQVESEFEPVPYTAMAARMYGRMSAEVAKLGRSPRARTADLMIAATAAVEGLALYTTNPDDFRGLESLLEIREVRRPRLAAG